MSVLTNIYYYKNPDCFFQINVIINCVSSAEGCCYDKNKKSYKENNNMERIGCKVNSNLGVSRNSEFDGVRRATNSCFYPYEYIFFSIFNIFDIFEKS